MLISHIRNRCIQSGRRNGESSALQCHTQPYNSGWLDPTPVIYFLSPGLSLCKMQMTLNFFMNFWGQSKPVSHPCGPSFCYCCSVHELDVLGPTSLPFWNSSSCKLCPPPDCGQFSTSRRNKWYKTSPGWMTVWLICSTTPWMGLRVRKLRKEDRVAIEGWRCWHACGREWGKKTSSKPSNLAFYFS